MKYLILAGGFATRLWPISEQRAKPLLYLNGKTILEHLLQTLSEAHIPPQDILILTNSAFAKDFESVKPKEATIYIEDAKSEGQKLGALRAVSECLQHFEIQENIAILAGDNLLTDFDPKNLHIKGNQAKIIVRNVPDLHQARKFGVIQTDPKDPTHITGFEEKPEHPTSTLVSTGFWSIGADFFPSLHAFAQEKPDNLGGIFQHWLESQTPIDLRAHLSQGDWFDIGSFETYLAAHKKIQKEPVLKGQNVEASDNQFAGKVSLGEGSSLHHCQITDSIIYPGAQLRNCHISQCIIDENVDLQGVSLNNKMVRRNTRVWREG